MRELQLVLPQNPMSLPIKIISTDFDGTLHSDSEVPRVPHRLERLIAQLQRAGAVWVINTGRDLKDLLEGLRLSGLSIRPDFVIVVEREIYQHVEGRWDSVEEWNQGCTGAHQTLFHEVKRSLPEAVNEIRARFQATIYEDGYSPFCLIAEDVETAAEIHEFLEGHFRDIPELTVVRNHVYARLSHRAYNKGTALAELGRLLNISREHIFAAGDHLNDLPMLSKNYANWIVAPANAVPMVKEAVLRQSGWVSDFNCGHGVAWGLERVLEMHGLPIVTAPE